jgi:hypothetical protein
MTNRVNARLASVNHSAGREPAASTSERTRRAKADRFESYLRSQSFQQLTRMSWVDLTRFEHRCDHNWVTNLASEAQKIPLATTSSLPR